MAEQNNKFMARSRSVNSFQKSTEHFQALLDKLKQQKLENQETKRSPN